MRCYFKVIYDPEYRDEIEYFDLYLENTMIADDICNEICRDPSVKDAFYRDGEPFCD